MISRALYQSLAPTFAKHARYRAARWDVDESEFENWMWEVLLSKGARVVHRCGPLLEQKPAYIATWAARYATKRVERQWHAESLDESMPYTVGPTYGNSFADYLEQIGAGWGIDVSAALDAIGGSEVSPAFEAYIRSLAPEDKRVAALLLSGLKRSHIAEQHLAPRPQARRIRQELIQVLKKAA